MSNNNSPRTQEFMKFLESAGMKGQLDGTDPTTGFSRIKIETPRDAFGNTDNDASDSIVNLLDALFGASVKSGSSTHAPETNEQDTGMSVADKGSEDDTAHLSLNVKGSSAIEFVSYLRYVISVEAARFKRESFAFDAHLSVGSNENLTSEE